MELQDKFHYIQLESHQHRVDLNGFNTDWKDDNQEDTKRSKSRRKSVNKHSGDHFFVKTDKSDSKLSAKLSAPWH
jgi:hypothetical protein